MSVPELNYGARFSPFEPPASHAHKAKHTPQEPPVPQAQNRDGSPCGSADLAPPPTAPPLRRKSSGYCECCQMAFTDMEQHVKCEQHLRFAEHSANYAVLDQLIGSLECLFLFSTAHSQDFQLSSSSSQCILVTSDLELKMSGQINQDALTHSHTHSHTHTHSPEKLAVTHTLSHAQNSQVQTHTHTLTHTHRPENSTQQTIPYPDTPTLSDTANPPTLNPPTLNHPTLNPPTLNPPTLSDTPTVNPEHSEEEEEQGEERKMKPLPSQSHTPVVPHTNPSDPSHLCKSLPSQDPSHTPPAHHDTPSDPSHLCMPLPSQGPSHTPPAHHDNPSDHSHILMPLPSVTFSPASSSAAVLLLVEHKMGAEPRENQANRLEVGSCVETLKSDWPSERTDPSPPVLLPCQPECDTSLRKRSQVECANPAPKRRRTAFESLRTPPPPLTPPPHLVTSCPTDLEPPLLHPYFHYDTPPEAHQQCPSSPPSLSPCPSPHPSHPSYPPWSSESDWDRGLLLRLTPAVPAAASEGRQRAELELMLLQSCTGLKDGSYHSRLCTALS
ncbi:cell surface glycoprotein 1-like [Clupea harengus]|uniref:Cell surface glycoprotein 1-like n=1 Tax=Clupea harengus TaxID=7950 RepID=A0A8M1KAP5_CLUHA|nr:cell surface glycoprotein 1-like [Clupea harengus]